MSVEQPLGNAAFWPAPAKLNLCLHIVGRRADGYHLLQSAMQFVEWCDRLNFFRRPAGIVERIAGPVDVPAEADLCIRAARLLAAESKRPVGVAIALHKRIPMQAGLGGGSSDAATVLVALNLLWDIGLSVERLADLGLQLGADIPFFVRGQAAWVEGVGERLTACEYDPAYFLVVKPAAAIGTAEIFNAPELTRNTPVTTIRALRDAEVWAGRNDCMPVVRTHYPEVARALDWLGQFAQARLTGTGACVFAEFSARPAAEAVLAQLPREWLGFIAQGLNRSPLLERVARERDE